VPDCESENLFSSQIDVDGSDVRICTLDCPIADHFSENNFCSTGTCFLYSEVTTDATKTHGVEVNLCVRECGSGKIVKYNDTLSAFECVPETDGCGETPYYYFINDVGEKECTTAVEDKCSVENNLCSDSTCLTYHASN